MACLRLVDRFRGAYYTGEPESLNRLLNGVDSRVSNVLVKHFGVNPADADVLRATLVRELSAPVVVAAMPIQDAIDLAEFMANVAINYSRFMPGPQTVGGAVEIATITKHEGFRWVKRKYFYSRDLNPSD